MILTNWYVITGAPSSGKTTLINQLAAAGYTIAPEIAREYIEKFLSENHTLNDIHANTYHLQRDILALALRRERHLEKEQIIFFDRGTTDSIGYFNYYKLDASHIAARCKHRRYKKIFYCHPLHMEHDAIRIENNLSAKEIGEHIYKSYIQLDYQLIELPAISVEKRMEIILTHLK